MKIQWLDRFRRRWRARVKRNLADMPPYSRFQIDERIKVIYGDLNVPACLLEKYRIHLAPLTIVAQEEFFCREVEPDAYHRRLKLERDAYLTRYQKAFERRVRVQDELEQKEREIMSRFLDMEASTGLQPSAESLAEDMHVSITAARRCIEAINNPIVNQEYYNNLFENIAEYKDIVIAIRKKFHVLSLKAFIDFGFDHRLAKGLANYLMTKYPWLDIPRVHFPVPVVPLLNISLQQAKCSIDEQEN